MGRGKLWRLSTKASAAHFMYCFVEGHRLCQRLILRPLFRELHPYPKDRLSRRFVHFFLLPDGCVTKPLMDPPSATAIDRHRSFCERLRPLYHRSCVAPSHRPLHRRNHRDGSSFCFAGHSVDLVNVWSRMMLDRLSDTMRARLLGPFSPPFMS